MSSLSYASIATRVAGMLLVAAACLLLLADAAWAIDGNYASPYASQYDTRSTSATIPNATWAGLLLLLVNLAAASAAAWRDRRRRAAA